MFNDDHRMAAIDRRIQRLEKFDNVKRMKSGRGLIDQKTVWAQRQDV